MPSLEIFVYDQIGKKITELGEIAMVEYPIQSVISLRPFLTEERMEGIRRRNGQEFPHIISIHNQGFVVDGHHKIRRALDQGEEYLYSKVLFSTNHVLATYLYKKSHGLVKNLQIR